MRKWDFCHWEIGGIICVSCCFLMRCLVNMWNVPAVDIATEVHKDATSARVAQLASLEDPEHAAGGSFVSSEMTGADLLGLGYASDSSNSNRIHPKVIHEQDGLLMNTWGIHIQSVCTRDELVWVPCNLRCLLTMVLRSHTLARGKAGIAEGGSSFFYWVSLKISRFHLLLEKAMLVKWIPALAQICSKWTKLGFDCRSLLDHWTPNATQYSDYLWILPI